MCPRMRTELSSLLNPGIEMYTDQGVFVGDVDDVVLNVDESDIYGIALDRLNPDFVEGEGRVIVPFRWVRSIGDIVIIKHLPERFRQALHVPEEHEEPAA